MRYGFEQGSGHPQGAAGNAVRVLCAELGDGTVVQGQSQISHSPGRIQRVFLKPSRCLPLAEALLAIRAADAVVLGPGSLYTSIIPNLLVKGIPEALAKTPAPKIYICNVMTQPGETDGYTASGHLEALVAHGGTTIDYAVVNTGPVPPRLRVRYLQMGANPVAADIEEIENGHPGRGRGPCARPMWCGTIP